MIKSKIIRIDEVKAFQQAAAQIVRQSFGAASELLDAERELLKEYEHDNGDCRRLGN